MKRLLVITATFPPVGGVGVFRITKFVKYLPEFGWQPVVLTLRPEFYRQRDDGFLDDLASNLVVRRTGIAGWVPFRAIGKRWLPVLLPAAERLARETQPAAVLITGPPFYPYLSGPYLHRRLGLPYVIDMRDAWHLDPYRVPASGSGTWLDRHLSGWAEPRVLRDAQYLVCASPHTVEDYRARYGDRGGSLDRSVRRGMPADRIVYLPNGFDPPDFDHLVPVAADCFRIVYAGKLVLGRKIDTFLTALGRLAQGGGPPFEFVFIGEVPPALRSQVAAAGLADHVRFVGFLPYRETLRWCKGADLLVVFSSGVKHEPTTKIFDYVGCRRPILVLGGGEGILAEYCREFASPHLCRVDHADDAAIWDALREFQAGHAALRGTSVVYNPDVERRYHRRALTERLAAWLNGL